MKKSTRNTLLGLGTAIVATVAVLLAPVTRYVSTTGNDQNTGAADSPYSTIGHCLNVSNINDVCEVAAGAYIEIVTITKSLSITCPSSNCITKGVIIKAGNVSVTGLSAKDAKGYGLYVQGDNITVTDFDIDGVDELQAGKGDTDGGRFFGKNIVIDGGIWKNIRCTNPSHCDGIQIWCDASHPSSDGVTFKNLEIYNFVWYFDPSGVISKGQGTQIEGGPSCSVKNITFEHNLIYSFRAANIGDSSRDSVTTNNINFINNTFVGICPRPVTGSNTSEYGIFITKGSNINASKNVFYCIDGNWLIGSVNATNNWIYRPDGGPNSPGVTGTNKTGNPMLDVNYHPLPGSPLCVLGWGVFPCGADVATVTSIPPTVTPQITRTMTPTATSTIAPITPSFTASPTTTVNASKTPLPATLTLVLSRTPSPTFTPVFSKTPAPATVTKTATRTPTLTPVVTVTATPTQKPPAVCKWLGWSHFWEWWKCVRG